MLGRCCRLRCDFIADFSPVLTISLFHFMIKRPIKWYQPHKSCGPISLQIGSFTFVAGAGASAASGCICAEKRWKICLLRLIENYISLC